MGHGATAGVRVHELRRTIALVADLIAATHLVDTPPSHTPSNYSGVQSNASHSPGDTGSANVGQELHPMNHPPYANRSSSKDLGIMDMQGIVDSADVSRKRCASSVPGNRAIKTMKLEPQDDVPLHINSSPINPLHPQASAYPPMQPFIPSNVASTPPSRPSSPKGLPHHAFNPVLQQQPQSLTFQDLDLASSTTGHHPDFTGLSCSLSSTPTHTAGAAGPPYPSPSVTRMSWSDGPATFPHRQHQHTGSGSSLSNGINLHGHGLPSAPIPFTTPGVFGSPPAPQLSQQRQGTGVNGVSISPTTSRPVGRVSRSGSMNGSTTNPFAFGQPEVLTQDIYGLNYTHSATTISRPQTPTSSPEDEYEYEYEYDQAFGSDAGDQSLAHSPSSQRGRGGTDGGRPSAGHHKHLQSQSSTENINQMSMNHGNEVPLEYRSEVDRVFFEFLESICSNCWSSRVILVSPLSHVTT
jgi:hypothetical protein